MVPSPPDESRVRSIFDRWPEDVEVDVDGHLAGVLGPQHFLRAVDHALGRPHPDRAGEAFVILARVDGIDRVRHDDGGQAAEQVLRHTAAAVSAAAPVVACVGRFAGPSFTVFCPHGGTAVADFLTEGIRTSVRDGEAGRRGIRMDFGIARARDGLDAAALVDAAWSDIARIETARHP